MTMLERALAEGVDPSLLVGWVDKPHQIWPILIRATDHWNLVRISPFMDGSYELETLDPMTVLVKGSLYECLRAADKYAAVHGGWAPAPIGFSRDEWLPIDTAPKDGSRFLATSKGCEVHVYYWRSGGFDDWCLEYANHVGWRPTHWRPLPTPPKEVG